MKRNMKKIIYIFTALMTFGMSSCSDMLDVDSTRQAFEPDFNQKTDSVFTMAGILNAMQQMVDTYVLQNELKGDMAALTDKADTSLVRLANYDYNAAVINRYDSAYVYYRVINNCNYYLAHRDTTLMTGNTKVAIPEYAAVLAIRAWAYLQAVRIYGKVKYFEQPLTTISQIEDDNSPYYDVNQVCDALIATLRPYAGVGTLLPQYGGNWTFGRDNTNTTKTVNVNKLMIPIDLMMAELLLEKGDYPNAANYYFTYFRQNKMTTRPLTCDFSQDAVTKLESEGFSIPTNFYGGNYKTYYPWLNNIFDNSGGSTHPEPIVYVPMAVNQKSGVISNLPAIFGYDYYAIYADSVYQGANIQMKLSEAYYKLADNQEFYYVPYVSNSDLTKRASFKGGDQRRWYVMGNNNRNRQDVNEYFVKYRYSYIQLFRRSAVYLHLAEALNRMGYPDAAFAVLKDGLKSDLLDTHEKLKTTLQKVQADFAAYKGRHSDWDSPTAASDIKDSTTLFKKSLAEAEAKFANKYLRDETINLLRQPNIGFGYADYASIFDENEGIHQHGCSDSYDGVYGTEGENSPYQLNAAVKAKWDELGLTIPATAADTLQAQIDAVEDLICDEYALELTLEGQRFSDLTRIARHKNMSSPAFLGAEYGSRWFNDKMKAARPTITKDLTNPDNWYLPFR